MTSSPTTVEPVGPLARDFFQRDVLEVAPQCLGMELIAYTDSGCASGRVVEVEAYRGPEDRAAHSFGGRRTLRNEAMFGPAGHAYVFLIYGIHCHVNIVTGSLGQPQAVLLRALEPLLGVETMQSRRARSLSSRKLTLRDLCSGPGKLCQALDIDRRFNGRDMLGDAPAASHERLCLVPGTPPPRIAVSPRIGIDYAGPWAAKLWRFYDASSPFVSHPPQRSS